MKKILVVDDSEVNLYLIQSTFEDNKNIQVDIESNSTKAIARLSEKKYDLLLLDLMMPIVDGFEILRKIKNNNLSPNTKIIVISAKQDQETIQLVLDYGALHYIKKPINLLEIESIVKKTLDI